MNSKNEKSIFLTAIEIESLKLRDAYVLDACGDDSALRSSVDALLASHEMSSELLDEHSDPQAQLHRQVQRAAQAFGLSPSAFDDSDSCEADRTGEQIGQYRLMEKLGEGGFGQVYVARQEQPLRREVAIKLLKPGVATKEVLARFEAERQALALMNHPNIAQVFDAGASRDGQPFIVMELVRGVPVNNFCRTKRLSLQARLSLFVDVCQAVHHAHQKGVIHRDLKPSNVLVAMHDTTAVVKVIDFGVAKALNGPLTEMTIYTRFAQLVGTPMYMSPEQAEMNAIDVDTRSDIYSLGVLLYELLTDCTPFDRTRMQTASFDAMRKIIREEVPPRPSARLTTVRAAAIASDEPLVNTHELSSQLRGDLDWVVMKALEKDRRRRYDTAADLSRDVGRYLKGEPVIARPPSQWYRLSKFANRHRLALTAVTLVMISLTVGTAVSIWQAIRATRAQLETEQLREEAVDVAKRLREANILLVSARANADQQRFDVAYAEYTLATQLSPDHFLTWAGRGSLLANLGAWHAAASDYATAIELGTPADDPSWWGVPHLLLYAGEHKAYAQVCMVLESRVRTADDMASATLAARSLCLEELAPQRAAMLAERMDELHKRSEHERPFAFPGPGQRPPPNRGLGGRMPPRGLPREMVTYAAALAHYRCGHYQRAFELMQNFKLHGEIPRGIVLAALPLQALIEHKLDRSEAAKKILGLAELERNRWLNEYLQTSFMAFPWFDGLETHLLLTEASREINGQKIDGDPLLKLEQTAMSLVRP